MAKKNEIATTSTKRKGGAAVSYCGCEHKGQDSIHGLGLRVFNWAPKQFNNIGGWRCTVCLRMKGDM